MKIPYDRDSLDGAERYMSKSNRTADTSSARKWIEQATSRMFAGNGRKVQEFGVLDRGIGFF